MPDLGNLHFLPHLSSSPALHSSGDAIRSSSVMMEDRPEGPAPVAAVPDFESKRGRSLEGSVPLSAAGSESKCSRRPESPEAAEAAGSESKSRCSPEGSVAAEASEIEPMCSRTPHADAPAGSNSKSSHSPEAPVAAEPAGLESKCSGSPEVSLAAAAEPAEQARSLSQCSNSTEAPFAGDAAVSESKWSQSLRFPISREITGTGLERKHRKASKKVDTDGNTSLADHVMAWKQKKMASGVPETKCFLPFLTNAPAMDICPKCGNFIFPGEEVHCSKGHCRQTYHLACAIEIMGPVGAKCFKCPQHACFVCKKAGNWLCVRCTAAAHDKCSPWPADIVHLESQSKRAICWRHPSDWHLEKKVG